MPYANALSLTAQTRRTSCQFTATADSFYVQERCILGATSLRPYVLSMSVLGSLLSVLAWTPLASVCFIMTFCRLFVVWRLFSVIHELLILDKVATQRM